MRYFYPRPPRGGRHIDAGGDHQGHRFLSTPSARRATAGAPHGRRCAWYFYPRPPRGGRPDVRGGERSIVVISIHALREEGDPPGEAEPRVDRLFLSTPSARRATKIFAPYRFIKTISIHALREEGDTETSRRCPAAWHFYPRPPRGGRHISLKKDFSFLLFLSTPSARRATLNFGGQGLIHDISIHALREEGDAMPLLMS